jgi:hypothetical protein
METSRLVEELARDLTPVRRLPRPGRRLCRWLIVSLPPALLLAWASGLRPDLPRQLADPAFLAYEGAALLTALLAAYAALCAGLPDQPTWKLWLPLAPLAVWLATLGGQCVEVLVRVGAGGLRISSDAMCLPAIALGGLVPAIAIVVMLRRSAGFRASHACLCGALAAAAIGAAALRLYHPQDAAIMLIVWQLGSVALLSALAGAVARILLAASANRRTHAHP